MKVFSDALGVAVELPDKPQRIVSLVSSATEALFVMGLGERVVGVSSYCSRYVDSLTSSVVGDYLKVDWNLLDRLSPDLVLVTTGLQRPVGLRLCERGYPTYALPLPCSLCGISENLALLGGLMNEVAAARRLRRTWDEHFSRLWQTRPRRPPRVYAELWFGRDQRTVGGLGFISDLIETAGGQNLYRDDPRPYFVPEPASIPQSRRPDIVVVFSEPDYPVDGHALVRERGWDRWPRPPFVVESSVEKGKNLIHDGPSLMETGTWLRSCYDCWAARA